MSFTNKYFIYLFPFFLHYNISCTSPRVNVLALSYTPDFSKKLFLSNLMKLENKAIKNPYDPSFLFKASKELTIFSYGFTMEEAAKLKISDYHEFKKLFVVGLTKIVCELESLNLYFLCFKSSPECGRNFKRFGVLILLRPPFVSLAVGNLPRARSGDTGFHNRSCCNKTADEPTPWLCWGRPSISYSAYTRQ